MKQFQFDSPNYTQTPNQLFDDLMKVIEDMSELKVTLAAVRMTMGYHVDAAELSIPYLEKMTGLSRNSVRRGLALSIQRGTIRVVKPCTNRTGGIYALGVKSGGSATATLGGQPQTPLKKEKEINNNNNARNEFQESCYRELEQLTGGYMGDAETLKGLYDAWQNKPDPRRHKEAIRQTTAAHSRTAKVYLKAYVTCNPDYVPPQAKPAPTYTARASQYQKPAPPAYRPPTDTEIKQRADAIKARIAARQGVT